MKHTITIEEHIITRVNNERDGAANINININVNVNDSQSFKHEAYCTCSWCCVSDSPEAVESAIKRHLQEPND